MKNNFKSVCKKLNKILSERKKDFIDKINKIVEEEVLNKGGNLYFDRDVYMKCDCDDEKVKNYVRESRHIQFEPTDDPDEHPGVTVRFKPYVYSMVKVNWEEYNKTFNVETLKELTEISETVMISWYRENDEKNETISLLVPHTDETGKKMWTIDGHFCHDYFDHIVITKFCPIIVFDL